MKISMYDASVKPGIRMMTNLATVLEKAEKHAEARKIDPEVFGAARLAPDMFPLSRQVQIASDTIKLGAARLAGADAPPYEDNEKTLAELIERAKKTAAYLETLKPQQFEGAEERTIRWKSRSTERSMPGLSIPASPGVAEPALSLHDGVRHPAPQRRRAREDGLPRARATGLSGLQP